MLKGVDNDIPLARRQSLHRVSDRNNNQLAFFIVFQRYQWLFIEDLFCVNTIDLESASPKLNIKIA